MHRGYMMCILRDIGVYTGDVHIRDQGGYIYRGHVQGMCIGVYEGDKRFLHNVQGYGGGYRGCINM